MLLSRMNASWPVPQTLADLVPAMIAYTDRDERFRFVNKKMAAWLGQPKDQLIGLTVLDVFGPEAYANIKSAITAARSGAPGSVEFETVRPDGKRLILESHYSPDVAGDGEIAGICILIIDVTKQRQAERALRESERRLRSIADSIPAVIVDVDLEERYRFVNKKMEDWFSRPASELIGHTVREVNGEEAYREFKWTTERAFAGQSSTVEFDAELPHKGLRNFRSDIVPQFDQTSKVEGYYVLTLDVSEQKKAADNLLKAKEEAEAANRAKSQFLANMSHEIRTPLNGILGMTGLLSDTELNKNQTHYVDVVRSSGQLLLTVINDILDFSKIEAGKLILEDVDFDIRDLLETTTALCAADAEAKSLTIATCTDVSVPEIITGDPNRLRQVLGNLISNAVKYTETGTISIHVISSNSSSKEVCLAFDITDTGIGIEPAVQERLFDAFEQADGSTSRRYGGTGLGLSIARQLVELMGGTISVQSEVGQGSTFSFEALFRIPASPSPTLPTPLEATPSRAGQRLGTRVMLAEDNAVNLEVARACLQEFGCEVVSVANGAEAVDLHTQLEFDLIFMDCQMPELDGYEATALIRLAESRTKTRHRTPIIALTAHALEEDRRRCLEAGMDDHLAKPFDRTHLDAVLQRWLPGAASDDARAAS